jgi:hypothetical protein
MTSYSFRSPSIEEVCASVRRLGYGARQNIRLYGEEFEVISDPFPEAGGIAVSVKTKKGNRVRVIQLPATVLQSVMGPLWSAA